MKVSIQKVFHPKDEEVLIRCVRETPEVSAIYSYALSKGARLSGILDGKLCHFSLNEVYYFEAVDEKLFAYTASNVYELRMRLYEAEDAYRERCFVRCSKSIVLNLMLLDGISPAVNGRFFAHMKNGEKLIITRSYVNAMKQAILRKVEQP